MDEITNAKLAAMNRDISPDDRFKAALSANLTPDEFVLFLTDLETTVALRNGEKELEIEYNEYLKSCDEERVFMKQWETDQIRKVDAYERAIEVTMPVVISRMYANNVNNLNLDDFTKIVDECAMRSVNSETGEIDTESIKTIADNMLYFAPKTGTTDQSCIFERMEKKK